jgi:hypothetical protein
MVATVGPVLSQDPYMDSLGALLNTADQSKRFWISKSKTKIPKHGGEL